MIMNNNVHYMKLRNNPFNLIKLGHKTIEMRLNDEKRSIIKNKDIIIFTNISTNEMLKTEVICLYKYKNFKELYLNHDKLSIGYYEDEIANYQDMYDYYSKEDIDKFGVLGIEIKIV